MAGGGDSGTGFLDLRRRARLLFLLASMLSLLVFQAYLTLRRPAGQASAPPAATPPAAAPSLPESGLPRLLAPAPPPIHAPPPAPSPGWLALDEAYRALAAGDHGAAERAFERALGLGHEPQRVLLELGWLAKARGDADTAHRRFAEAADGPSSRLAALARAELRAADDARRAAALAAGARRREAAAGAPEPAAPAQTPDLDPAPPTALLASRDGPPTPHGRPRAAADADWTLDLYAETVGWNRLSGPSGSAAVVPTFRLRALRRLPVEPDLSVYGFAQLTRELGAIEVRGGAPVLHADDSAIAGAGLLLRLAGGHAGLFAQAGSAMATAPGRAGALRLDLRAGGFLAAETARCWPAPARGLRLRVDPCAELYAEAVYVSRFEHDVLALARGRAGATLLTAGPVALGLVAEARALGDRNGDWYDNLGELGAGLRARLLAPFRLDVTATATAGRFLGRAGRDPAPSGLGFADLRVVAATFVEL